jgi:hypothetical protein
MKFGMKKKFRYGVPAHTGTFRALQVSEAQVRWARRMTASQSQFQLHGVPQSGGGGELTPSACHEMLNTTWDLDAYFETSQVTENGHGIRKSGRHKPLQIKHNLLTMVAREPGSKVRSGFIWLRARTSSRLCEHGNEYFGFKMPEIS